MQNALVCWKRNYQISEKRRLLPHQVFVQINVGYESKKFLTVKAASCVVGSAAADEELLLLLFQGCGVQWHLRTPVTSAHLHI